MADQLRGGATIGGYLATHYGNLISQLSTIGNISINGGLRILSTPSSSMYNSGIIFKDETSATEWQFHSHGDRMSMYNGTTSKYLAFTTDKLSAFASTTSAELAGIISDKTGSGSLVFATSPTLVTPSLGVATATSINGYTIGHNTHAQNTDAGTNSVTFGIYYGGTLSATGYGIYFGGTAAAANPYIRWNNASTKFELYSDYNASTLARLDVSSINGFTIAHSSHSNANDHANTQVAHSWYTKASIEGLLTGAITSHTHSYLPLSGGTLTGLLTLSGAPSSDLHATTKLYVDNLVATGVNYIDPAVVFNLISDALSTPPATPTTGDAYVVATTGTGAWAGKDSHIVQWNGTIWEDLGALTNPTRAIITSGTPAGSFASQAKKIATYTTAWAFAIPATGNTLSITKGYYSGYQFNYNNSGAWVNIGFPTALTVGTGLNKVGNEISISSPISVTIGGTGLTSVTAGYVPFGNSSTALNTDTNLYWDNTNKRLGLGTVSPDTALQVNYTSSSATLTGKTAYGGIHLVPSGVNDRYVGITATYSSIHGTQAGILFQSSGGYGTKIHFLTTESFSDGQKLRMTLDAFGKLGIGTNSPSEFLEVAGYIRALSGYKVGDNAFIDSNRNFTGGMGTFTGALSTSSNISVGANLYLTNSTYGINLNNSDITGANAIYFGDLVDSGGEGINFYRSSGYWDRLYSAIGNLYYQPNAATSDAIGGYIIWHTGNITFSTTAVSTAVLRDASGNFTAGTITATLSGNATTATTANNLKSNATTGVIQIVGPTAGTTRVMTLPDANATLLYSGGALGTPSSGTLTNCTFPTLNQNTTGSAAKWTTARTITLGGDLTGSISLDGSANVTLTATVVDDSHNHIIGDVDNLQATLDTKEYYQPLNTVRTNAGSPSVREMALFHGEFNNKFRFIPAILQEESTNGTTWVTSARLTTDNLKDLMLGEGQTISVVAIPAPAVGGTGYYRLTFDCSVTGYVYLNHFYCYCNTAGNTVNFKIEKRLPSTQAWSTVASGNTSNWPGHISIPHDSIAFSTATDGVHYDQVRVTFSITSATYANPLELCGIEWFGGYPAGKRNVESYDRNKNVYFPVRVSGTQLVASIADGTTPLLITSTTKVANLNVDRLDDMHADSANTASTIVARNASGDFATGVITTTGIKSSNSAPTVIYGGDGSSVNNNNYIDIRPYSTIYGLILREDSATTKWANFQVDSEARPNKLFITYINSGENTTKLGLDIDASGNIGISGNTTITGGTLTLGNATSNLISFANYGSGTPSASSLGRKIQIWGNGSGYYGIGVEAATQWYDALTNHRFYTNDGTTWTQRFNISSTAITTTLPLTSGAITTPSLTSTGALGLNAGGTNQNITLNPTGTGIVDVVSQLQVSSSTWPPLRVIRTTTNTDTMYGGMTTQSKTSGDMVDGFGVSYSMEIVDSAGIVNEIAKFGAVRQGADNSGRLVFNTTNAGTSTERMTLDKEGKLGIGCIPTAGASGILQVGVINHSSSSAIAQFGGFLRIKDQLIIHDASILANSFLMQYTTANGLGLQKGEGSGSANMFFTGGNVGIGTTAPGGIFDIQSSSSGLVLARVWNTNTSGTGYSELRIANSGNNSGGSRLVFSDSAYYVGAISGDRTSGLIFRTSANGTDPATITEAMRIDTSGRVGIGTTNPLSMLTVQKAVVGGRGGEISIVNYATLTTGNEAALNFGLEASTYDANNGNAQIKAILNGISGASTDMVFTLWSGSAFTERMRITSSGNVGIGCTPGQTLDVGDATTDYIRSYGGFVGNATANIGGTGAAAYFPSGLYSNGSSAWIYGQVNFNGAVTGATTITSTTSMTTANFVSTAVATSGYSFWASPNSYKIYMANYDANGAGRLDTTSDYNMYFRMTGGTNRGFVFQGGASGTTNVAQIDASGNIYTTGTSLKFSSTATIAVTGSLYLGPSSALTRINSGDHYLDIDGYTNARVTMTSEDCAIEIRATSSNSAQVFLGTDGDVGFGTTSPGEKVDVVGTVKASTGFKTGNFYIVQDDVSGCLCFNII